MAENFISVLLSVDVLFCIFSASHFLRYVSMNLEKYFGGIYCG